MIVVAVLCTGGFAALLGARLAGVRPEAVRPARPGRARRFATWLAESGAGVTPAQFVAGSVAAGVGVFGLAVLLTGTPLVGVPPACAAALLPRTYFARRRAARRHAVLAAWPDTLRELSAGVGAGRALGQALRDLAVAAPAPLAEAFASFASLDRALGATGALEVVKADLADPTSDRIVEVLVLALERGGPIVARILDDLVVATSKDLKVLDEIESDRLEMKLNARAVLAMPWLVLVALTVRPGPFRDFYSSTAGLLVVMAGAALCVVGASWIGRLGRVATEPRVLAAPVGGGGRP